MIANKWKRNPSITKVDVDVSNVVEPDSYIGAERSLMVKAISTKRYVRRASRHFSIPTTPPLEWVVRISFLLLSDRFVLSFLAFDATQTPKRTTIVSLRIERTGTRKPNYFRQATKGCSREEGSRNRTRTGRTRNGFEKVAREWDGWTQSFREVLPNGRKASRLPVMEWIVDACVQIPKSAIEIVSSILWFYARSVSSTSWSMHSLFFRVREYCHVHDFSVLSLLVVITKDSKTLYIKFRQDEIF